MVPKQTKYVAYLRVSTDKQGVVGLGIQAQQYDVDRYITTNGGVKLAEYVEVESGKRNNRPKLAEALKHARLTNAVMLVAKLDRLGRNAAFLNTLLDSRVKVICCDMPTADKFMLGVFAQLAQKERELISERTKAALARIKASGRKLGNPSGKHGGTKKTALHASQANVSCANARAHDLGDVIVDARQRGYTTLQSIADHLNSLGIATPRGGVWYPTSVKNLIARLDAA